MDFDEKNSRNIKQDNTNLATTKIQQQEEVTQQGEEVTQQGEEVTQQVQQAQQQEKPDKKFRISAKRLCLTYSKLPNQISLESVRDALQQKLTADKYLISREIHQDGQVHFHALLQGTTKFDIRNPRFLDIEFLGKKYHGNYQRVGNLYKLAKYIAKDRDMITNYDNFVNGAFLTMQEDIASTAIKHGAKAATRKFLEKYTNHAFKGMNILNADKHLNAFLEKYNDCKRDEEQEQEQEQDQLVPLDPNDIPLQLQDFNLQQLTKDRIQQWMQGKMQPTMVIVGPPGVGKTLLATALLAHNRATVLELNHFEGLAQLKPQHNAILYDDPSFQGMTEAQLLAIFQTDQKKKLFRVLRNTVNRPGGLTQVITMNYQALRAFRKKFSTQQFARRMLIVDLKQSVVNINVNVHLQVHANIFNNPQNIKENLEILNSLK